MSTVKVEDLFDLSSHHPLLTDVGSKAESKEFISSVRNITQHSHRNPCSKVMVLSTLSTSKPGRNLGDAMDSTLRQAVKVFQGFQKRLNPRLSGYDTRRSRILEERKQSLCASSTEKQKVHHASDREKMEPIYPMEQRESFILWTS